MRCWRQNYSLRRPRLNQEVRLRAALFGLERLFFFCGGFVFHWVPHASGDRPLNSTGGNQGPSRRWAERFWARAIFLQSAATSLMKPS